MKEITIQLKPGAVAIPRRDAWTKVILRAPPPFRGNICYIYEATMQMKQKSLYIEHPVPNDLFYIHCELTPLGYRIVFP